MGKAVYVGLAALAVWSAGADAHAASPVVAGDYDLWNAAGLMFLTEVTTSPNGVAIFHWGTFESEANLPNVAVMKNAGDPYVAAGVRTAALNRDWYKIAVSREIQVFGPPEEVAAATYADDFRGIGRVSRPVIVDLETGAETPLAVAGGDFLYWLNDDELVVGRETSGHERVGLGTMEAIKYDVRNGEREPFAFEDLTRLLNERCTVGVTEVDSIYYPGSYARPGYLNPPYTSKDWRLLPAACISEREKPAPPVAVPSRGGRFENDEGTIYWVPAAGGPKAKVAAGNALAASDDGVWLLVIRFDHTYDPPWYERFYGLRLAWQ